jgi:hypothetical protein
MPIQNRIIEANKVAHDTPINDSTLNCAHDIPIEPTAATPSEPCPSCGRALGRFASDIPDLYAGKSKISHVRNVTVHATDFFSNARQ